MLAVPSIMHSFPAVGVPLETHNAHCNEHGGVWMCYTPPGMATMIKHIISSYGCFLPSL